MSAKVVGGVKAGAAVVCACLLQIACTAAAPRSFDEVSRTLVPNRWMEIHRQSPGDAVVFRRQAHGGSAFDTRRGRIVMFGSDTHGEDWTNSPLCFDVASLTWQRAYADDDPSSYRVSAEGLPVAGPAGAHPWAMHTYGAVAYGARHDRLIVASYPAHMEPGRFSDALAALWPRVQRHPTWIFDFSAARWTPLPASPQHFFPYATVYDPERDVVVGYRADGIFELPLGGPSPEWRRVADSSHKAYHINGVYDSAHRLVIFAGAHTLSNDVVVYDPAQRRDRVMPTPGRRPPPFQHAPMAYHERKRVALVIVDREAKGSADSAVGAGAETWAYDPASDTWARIEGAALAHAVEMNYNMHYDPVRDVALLVTSAPDGATEVWALRLD